MELFTTHTGSTLPHLEVGVFYTGLANNEIMIVIKICRVLAELIANLACDSTSRVKGQLYLLSAGAQLGCSACQDRLT